MLKFNKKLEILDKINIFHAFLPFWVDSSFLFPDTGLGGACIGLFIVWLLISTIFLGIFFFGLDSTL